MSELVADCPRCHSKRMTFDLLQQLHIRTNYGWQFVYETFCVCRHCNRSTIFVLSQDVNDKSEYRTLIHQHGLLTLKGSVNNHMKTDGYISEKDASAVVAPQFLPPEIEAAFNEGAKCLAVSCFNAAGTMFRLCVDLATRELLPTAETPGLNGRTRRDLGLRLPWLFEAKLLPADLKDLSSCVKEDGNDGAHKGTLSEHDATDLLDFIEALLSRMYTEPKRIELAGERRAARRAP